MLQAAHLHWAPNADRVSISTWKQQKAGLSWVWKPQSVCSEPFFFFFFYSQQFGPWCECSPPLWPQRAASPPELASSEPSAPASLRGTHNNWVDPLFHQQFIIKSKNVSCCILGFIKKKPWKEYFFFYFWLPGDLVIAEFWRVRLRVTLLCNLDFSASKVGLFDVFDAEVAVAFGVLLLFVPGRRLIIGAVRVRRRWKQTGTRLLLQRETPWIKTGLWGETPGSC